GVREAIRALGQLTDCGATLDVVGDGEDLPACRALAVELHLADRVRFHGHLPPVEVDELYARADLFVFPSFREPSAKAVLEALSHGLPVIAVDHGGPAAVLDEQCGRLVAAEPDRDLARDVAAQIEDLLGRPELVRALAAGALARVAERYTWDRKVDALC